MSLASLTLTEAISAIKNKKISHAELYDDVFQQIAAKNEKLNIYLALADRHTTLATAEKLRELPLAGIPVAVKDNYCTIGLPTTASALLLKNFIPQFDATVIRKLHLNGGVTVGKTNLDAWAHGSSTETSQFGRTVNPRNTDHLPGGSSGGSAAAVAANTCIAALGTETAGSIRQPAAWCGVVGLKPTYGRCSRYGIVAMASSTDSPGPIAKTVKDAAVLLQSIAGHDPLDATSSTNTLPNLVEACGKSIKGMKIGYVYHDLPGIEKTSELFSQQLAVFTDLGAHVERVNALDPRYAVGVYTVVQRGEVSSNLARYDGIRYGNDRTFFGEEAKRRIMLGTFTLSKGYADQYYTLAQKVRTLFIEDFATLFAKYDVLVSLSSPGYAKKIGATEGAAMFGELEDMLLEPSSIAGLPGLNVPCFKDAASNLFLGMNIVAPFWREDLLVQVGHAYENATQWNEWSHHAA